jgi:hypothetical protein
MWHLTYLVQALRIHIPLALVASRVASSHSLLEYPPPTSSLACQACFFTSLPHSIETTSATTLHDDTFFRNPIMYVWHSDRFWATRSLLKQSWIARELRWYLVPLGRGCGYLYLPAFIYLATSFRFSRSDFLPTFLLHYDISVVFFSFWLQVEQNQKMNVAKAQEA